jgi:hypothetical protein
MGWTPESGFLDNDWVGYNEAMIVYLLALGSETFPVDPESWASWTSSFDNDWGTFYGQEHLAFRPLFGHQYSHVWVDFRGIHDRFIGDRGLDYFENSRRATYTQRAYAMANPDGWKDYGANVWGLTACDGPAKVELDFGGKLRTFQRYWARGWGYNDDGTLAPTAAASAIAFAPEIAIPAIREMRARYGPAIYGKYGFIDAFNPSFNSEPASGTVVPGVGWVDVDYLGIDVGPTLAMIENWRSGFIWRTMSGNAYLKRGLVRAGFTGGWLDQSP